jgi:putative nucleotidyltransferase with HDIG domain
MPQERILVVDDDSVVRNIIAVMLSRSGYYPTVAANADEALNILREDPGFDLVLSDIMMPGKDGIALLDQIRTDHPGVPVVLSTAVHDIHVATNAFRRGAVDYLLKPFERPQLESVVARAIEHGRLLQQNNTYRHNLEHMVSERTTQLRTALQDLERSYDVTLEAMGAALDLRDEETEGHSRRVTAYTVALAQAMGVSSEELRVIERGAFLHDIGKIAVPDRILRKPGRLDSGEIAIMRGHCERGYEMVRKIPFLREAAEIVYSHQEHFDGSGYPRGLRGDQIPLGARIFAIADTLDAMTSDRPYRKGTTLEKARQEIVRCSGTQFDPAIVDVFLRISSADWNALRDMTNQQLNALNILLHPRSRSV